MSLPCLSFIGSTCLLLFDNYNSFQIAYDNVFSHNRLTLSTPQSILEVPKAKRITAPQFIRLNPTNERNCPMKINEQYHNLNLLENVTYEFLGRDGETHEETEPILVEHMMDVYVNERLTMKLVCIPQHLTELVLGRLFTEGIISSAEDVSRSTSVNSANVPA